MALETGLGAALGLGAISETTVLAGILAVLVDMDHVELPPFRTPAGHSLPAAAFWTYLAAAAAMLLFPSWTVTAAVAAFCAFASHLSLDSLTGGGIFLWPADIASSEWLRPLPAGSLLQHDGARYLSADEKDHQALSDGRLAWPGWRRWRAPLPASISSAGLPIDAVVSSLGLGGLVAAAAWG